MINNRFNVVYHLLGFVINLFYLCNMKTIFLSMVFLSWGLAILFSIISTIVVWKTENKVKWASWSNLGWMWVASILFGWALGIPMLIVMLESIDKQKPHP